MIEKLPCHDEIVYEIQRAIQTFGPLTAQSLMKRRAQVTASNECDNFYLSQYDMNEFSELYIVRKGCTKAWAAAHKGLDFARAII